MQLKHCLAPSATFPLMKWSSLKNVIHRRLQRRRQRRRRRRQESLRRHCRRRNRRRRRCMCCRTIIPDWLLESEADGAGMREVSPAPTYCGPHDEVPINHTLEQMGIPTSISGHLLAYTAASYSSDASIDVPDICELDDFSGGERPC